MLSRKIIASDHRKMPAIAFYDDGRAQIKISFHYRVKAGERPPKAP
jgi:hypothetical protein